MSGSLLLLEPPDEEIINPHTASANPEIPSLHVHALPDELLTEILDQVSPSPRHPYLPRKPNLDLPLVCKRWSRVYEGILFRWICISRIDFNGPSLMKILSLLQDHPHLRQYPRILHITSLIWFSNFDITATCGIISSIIKLCTEIDEVVIRIPFKPEMEQQILPLCSSISRLRRVHLEGNDPFLIPSLRTISSDFMSSSLRELSLRDYASGGVNELSQVPVRKAVIPQEQLESLLPPALYHTGTVTKMNLSHPMCYPNVTRHILRWPARLTHLALDHYRRSPNAEWYTIPTIQGLLDIHASSLKHIVLGRSFTPRPPGPRTPDTLPPIASTSTPSLDFSSFPSLSTLKMSAFDVLSTNPETAVRNLSAPSLHHLTLTFLNDNSLGPNYRSYFQRQQASWVEEFAFLREKYFPGSKLKVMEVLFHVYERPEEKRWIWRAIQRGEMEKVVDWKGDLLPVSWPWECLEEASETVRALGLDVRFDSNYSREEWDRIVQDTEADIE